MRVPALEWIGSYLARYLGADIMAGVVVAALAMPQSLGYAGIAGVPVLVGLYSIPLALIAYAVFGSSPRLVVGPVSTVSVLSGSLVADLSGGDPAQAVAMTSALALAAGGCSSSAACSNWVGPPSSCRDRSSPVSCSGWCC